MNRKVVLSLVLLLTLGFIPAAISNTQERGYISVYTNAEEEVSPDTAEISFAVKTTDAKSLQKASIDNRAISDRVLKELNALINTQNGDYVKTSDYNASPVYSYKDSKKILDRYEVSNKVIIHTKSIDKLGIMIDKATQAGATNVDSLNFSLANYDSKCDDLVAKVSAKAKRRADIIANTLATSVVGIRTFDTSCSANNNSSVRYYAANKMLSAVADGIAESTPATSISNGVIRINASANATFFVK